MTPTNFTLYIDGDTLPNLLKPILLKQIVRLKLPTIVVANKKITIGNTPYIESIIVDAGADEADNKIVELLRAGDLVITADIPLADRVITKDAHAIDHRGERYTPENIKQYLAMRNLMEMIRESGEMTKGPKPFGQKDAQQFANQLNAFLSRVPILDSTLPYNTKASKRRGLESRLLDRLGTSVCHEWLKD